MIKKIKVLVVDDSFVFRKFLTDNLDREENLDVVGFAVDAMDAMEKVPELQPDVITLDVEMPKINGIEFLKSFIPKYPIPVVLVSSVSLNVFSALSAGAVEFVKKPDMSSSTSLEDFVKDLISKVNSASYAKVRQFTSSSNNDRGTNMPIINIPPSSINNVIVGIGASTGGTEAVLTLLKDLPKNFPGVVVVQHMPSGFTKMYADRLNKVCKLDVKEAENGDRIEPGKVLIAPGDLQMRVKHSGAFYTVTCTDGDKVSGHRPSVDVLFDSLAQVKKNRAIGVILTGMGKDGAVGLLNMKKNGAYTIGQDKNSCVVYGMPMVAFNIGAVETQVPLEKIAVTLQNKLAKFS